MLATGVTSLCRRAVVAGGPQLSGRACGVMMPNLNISQLAELPSELEALVDLSLREGLRFLQRLIEEWASGANRFTKPGEALFAAWHGSQVVGVCGVNRDPYTPDPAVGRLRNLYVVPPYRRRGVGRALVLRALSRARGHFRVVRLRTDIDEAGLFYRALGFAPTLDAVNATHQLSLAAWRDPARAPDGDWDGVPFIERTIDGP